MGVQVWMVRISADNVSESLQIVEVAKLLEEGRTNGCAVRVYEWVCGVFDWSCAALYLLKQIQAECDEKEEVEDAISSITTSIHELSWLLREIRRSVFFVDVNDGDLVAKWYINARLIFNEIKKALMNVKMCSHVEAEM